jgi:hypothetical protein
MVFQAPQAGHRPCHFGVSLPQAVQKKTVFALAIGLILTLSQDYYLL